MGRNRNGPTSGTVAGQPEEREYQAQGVIADAVIGQPSAIEPVLVPVLVPG